MYGSVHTLAQAHGSVLFLPARAVRFSGGGEVAGVYGKGEASRSNGDRPKVGVIGCGNVAVNFHLPDNPANKEGFEMVAELARAAGDTANVNVNLGV